MSTQTVDYLEAIEHLPEGQVLRYSSVGWDEYEQLLSDLGDRPGQRVWYDQGELFIMTLLPEHERHKGVFSRMAQVLSEELGVTLETLGSTTFRQQRKAKGAEPDESFYVQNAHRIIGKRTLDLDEDPPPDVVVEIDITHASRSKFPIYAALGVPEIWRYDGEAIEIYHLQGAEYREDTNSRTFPLLSAEVIAQVVEQAKTEGQSAALAAFRLWVRQQGAA
ncbi:MAG TPA: Uma2 family endonuclease [Blastocatellia bacterium]|nr:Uma2 family endonuclease [Blastocatellia bacterium]